jgi:hypothetical protein
MKHSKQDVTEARERLLEWLKPGDTVHTILRHVSRSGMQRTISLYKLGADRPYLLDWSVAAVLGMTLDQRDGVKVGGCGMDMGFHLVYNLGEHLWPDGFTCSGEGCQSCDHSNGDRNYARHQHSDGGYALRHQWL